MYTSPNLGLTIWDQPQDDFNHSQLLLNWQAIDGHDHSPGKGVQIGTAGLLDASVTQTKLAALSVGTPQLQNGAVATANIAARAVGNAQIAAGAIYGNLIPSGAITAAMLDPTIVPLGAVMLWWRPPNTNTAPGGFWEAMDGRNWSSITNAFNLTTGTIPDTRGIFAKGADPLGVHGPLIGATGGSATANLAHTHGVLGHTHTTPSHNHSISSDGSHTHTWQGGLSVWSRTNCFAIGLTMDDFSNTQRQNTYLSMYIKNLLNTNWDITQQDQNLADLDAQVNMDAAGAHNHGGATGNGGGSTTGSSTATTDSQLGSTTVDPPWAGLLYIMRCR